MRRNALVLALWVVVSCDSSNSSGPSTQSSDDTKGGTDTVGKPTDAPGSGGDDDTKGSDDHRETDSTPNSDTDSDTHNGTPTCPDGYEMHTTSSGRVVCCDDEKPLFCDENDDGYQGSCWQTGVSCESITLCGGSFYSCFENNIPYCDEEENFTCYPCDEDSTRYTSRSGRPFCCGGERPVFCDENDDGFGGGCFAENVDCETLTLCDGKWLVCLEGSLPYCDDAGKMTCHICPDDSVRYETTSGKPVCCDEDHPTFCDENSEADYTGGCWSPQIDCSTIIPCGDFWGACASGMQASCENDNVVCREE